MALDVIAQAYHCGPWRKRFQGLATDLVIGSNKFLLLKPQTFYKLFGHDVVLSRWIELVGGACKHLSKSGLEPGQFFFNLRKELCKGVFSLEHADGLGLSIEGPQFRGVQSSLVLESGLYIAATKYRR